MLAAHRRSSGRSPRSCAAAIGQPLELADAANCSAYRAGKIGALLIVLALLRVDRSRSSSMFSDLNKTTAAFDPVLRFDQIFGFIAFIGGFLLIAVESRSGVERRPPLAGEAVEHRARARRVHRVVGRLRVPSHQLGSELLMACAQAARRGREAAARIAVPHLRLRVRSAGCRRRHARRRHASRPRRSVRRLLSQRQRAGDGRRDRSAIATRSKPASTAIELQKLMPPGGARNAVDCAMWDLEAQRTGKIGLAARRACRRSKPLVTTFTIGADDPDGDGRRRAQVTRKRARSR